MKLRCRYVQTDFSNFPWANIELDIDPKKSAFIIVDMQNAFCSKGSLLDLFRVDMARPARIIEPVARVAEACRKIGIRVIYTQHTHRPDFSDQDPSFKEFRSHISATGIEGFRLVAPKVPIKGSWHAAIIDELQPEDGDIIIDSKHTYTAFYHTDLEPILRNLEIETLFFSGATTSVCVESTLRDAFFRGFRCILITDCVYEKTDDLQEATENDVGLMFGYLTKSTEVLECCRW